MSFARNHHPALHTLVVQAQKGKGRASSKVPESQTLAGVVNRDQKYDRKTKRWREVTDAVTYCLAKDMLPLHTVDKRDFRRMVEALDPRYDLPSTKYFSKTAIPSLYDQTCAKVAAEVQPDKDKVNMLVCSWLGICHSVYV